MRFDKQEPGKQSRACPECAGQMELRLGMWDCGRCGHTEQPEQRIDQSSLPDPTDSVNRARLITRPDAALPSGMSNSSAGNPLQRSQELRTEQLPMRLLCGSAQLGLALIAHAYIFLDGQHRAWVYADRLPARFGLQAVYVFLIVVGLIWREALTKYIALGISVLMFIGLLIITFMDYDIVPEWELRRSEIFPMVPPWYWAVLLLLHAGLMFWIFSIILRDLAQIERSRGR